MGRLENIVARNRRGNRPRERTVVSIWFGLVVLIILGLMMFTDLGLPAGAKRTSDSSTEKPGTEHAGKTGKHVDNVLLLPSPKAKPAAGSAKSD